MKEIRKDDVARVLREGVVIFLKGSTKGEERLYRLNNNILEYSDNNKDWTISNMLLEELEAREWIIFEG